MSYIWPIVLIVASNVIYQICAKSVPENMDVLASMTITYFVGTICSAVMFFAINRNASLLHEYSKLNAAPVLLGISVVGLEVGFICAYKAGWPVSTTSIVQSAFLALALVFVGGLLYHEAITPSKIAGVMVCLAGLYLINK